MFTRLKNWFVPCRGNNYEPHALRAWPVTVLLAVIIVFFGASQLLVRSLSDTDGILAAVVSSVLVDLTNIDRAQNELHSLSVNPMLVEAARLKAADMATKGYFAHNAPDGKTPWYWFNEAEYGFSYAGENLAVFFGDSEDVERAWMNSPSHRANILNSNFTEIGIATAEGVYQGRQTTFVVQMFGTPTGAAPVATVQSEPVSARAAGAPLGEVASESIEAVTDENSESVKIIHQDETFIAVKSAAPATPSAVAPSAQSTMFERLIASPQTLLLWAYGTLGALVALSLILLVFVEIRVQRPKNVAFGLLLLVVMGTLSFFSYTSVVVASVEPLAALL